MKHSILLLAIVCAFVSFLSFGAPRVPYSDANWAFQVCETAGDLCHRPLLFAVAAAVLAGVWVMARRWCRIADADRQKEAPAGHQKRQTALARRRP